MDVESGRYFPRYFFVERVIQFIEEKSERVQYMLVFIYHQQNTYLVIFNSLFFKPSFAVDINTDQLCKDSINNMFYLSKYKYLKVIENATFS